MRHTAGSMMKYEHLLNPPNTRKDEGVGMTGVLDRGEFKVLSICLLGRD